MRHTWLGLILAIFLPSVLIAQEKASPMLVLDSGGHTSLIWDVAFLAGSDRIVSVSYDKTIRLWDLSSGQSIRVLRPPIGPGNAGRLICASVSPDGKLLAVGGIGVPPIRNPIYLISLETGQILRILQGHQTPVNTVVFSPDGQQLASSANDATGRIWETSTGRCVHILQGHTHRAVNEITFSPDGKTVGTACLDQTARLWSVKTGAEQHQLKHKGKVLWLGFHPDGTSLATVSGSCLCVWNEEGKLVKEHDLGGELNYCRFLADGKQVLVTGERSGLVDIETRAFRRLGQGRTTGGAASPDGKRAVTVTEQGAIHVWDTERAELIKSLSGTSQALWAAGWQGEDTLAFGSEGERRPHTVNPSFALTHSFRVTDFESGAAVNARCLRGQIEQDGRRLRKKGAYALALWRDDLEICIFEPKKINSGDENIRSFTFLGAKQGALADGNGRLFLLDLEAGRVAREWQGHAGAVWSLAPSPKGRYLLSASNDHTLRVWSPDQDAPLLSLFFAGRDWIAWTPEGYYAASPGGEKLMGWQVSNGPEHMGSFYPAADFRKTLYRPDVIKRLLQAGSVERALQLAGQAEGRPSTPTEVSKVLPPRVRILSPRRHEVTLKQAQLHVEAEVEPRTGQPVTEVQLLLDGRLAPARRLSDSPGSSRLQKYAWAVELPPGEHRLSVRAHAVASGESEPVVLRYLPPQHDARAGTLHVLAIGINAYPGKLRLECAAPDAQAIAAAFAKYSNKLFRRVEPHLLLNREATRKTILARLDGMAQQARFGDLVIVFLAGHGDCQREGRFYFLPSDADPRRLAQTGVSGEELRHKLGRMPCTAMLILDACFAGSIDAPHKHRTRALPSGADNLVRDLVYDQGLVVLCGADKDHEAVEEKGHGFFTRALVEGLSGRAQRRKDGTIYLSALQTYLEERVPELSDGEQIPTMSIPSVVRGFPIAKP